MRRQMSPTCRTAALLVSLLFVVAAPQAHAQKSKARALISEGTRLYGAGQYQDALDRFTAAHNLNNDPAMLFNIGHCQRKLGEFAAAISSYQGYLAERPDAANRADVERYIDSCKQSLAREQAAAEAAKPPPPTVNSPPVETPPEPPPSTKKSELKLPSKYALGVRVRGIFVPSSFLKPYLQASTAMNSASLGLEFIYRKPTYDVVTSLDFSFLNVQAGNYLANGHDADADTHFTQFRNLNFLSADVSIIGHHTWEKAPWFEFRYGAGLGLGLVLGDVLLTNDGTQCTKANASNIKQCYPVNPNGTPVRLGTPNQEADLKATESNPGTDTNINPKRHVSPDKPPAMAVLNILIGFKFRLHAHVSAQVEVGFRDAMFAGVGLHYWF